MKAGRLVLATILVLHSFSLAVWCNASQNFTLTGIIKTPSSRSGGRFTVKLYPPKNSGRAVLATVADGAGNFKFTGLATSSYLLEIYLGADMVHQQVLTIDKDQSITIELH